ncbi:MAG: sigma 54-interacting transcriptional regulator, partial [Candidatus Rokuibacteriota bacterium]
PFVRVNCAAIPGDLLESEMFGHERGAFTGAERRRLGKFERADGGTLFLDEIGDLPLALQAKLLHVLEDRELTRVGGTQPCRIDARVIAASNRNLVAAARRGEFREDIYHRLSVIVIEVPPLRERKEEIPELARLFLQRFNEEAGSAVALSAELLALLVEHDWPGNVRELEHMMRRMVVLGDADVIRQDLAAPRGDRVPPDTLEATAVEPPVRSLKAIARRAARDAERLAISEALERTRWNRAQAARLLGISYKALLYKMAQCELSGRILR